MDVSSRYRSEVTQFTLPWWRFSLKLIRESPITSALLDGGFLLALATAIVGVYFMPEFVVSIVVVATLMAFIGETALLRPQSYAEVSLNATPVVSLAKPVDSERGLRAAVGVSRVLVFVALFCLLVEMVAPSNEENFLMVFANAAVVALPVGFALSMCSPS